MSRSCYFIYCFDFINNEVAFSCPLSPNPQYPEVQSEVNLPICYDRLGKECANPQHRPLRHAISRATCHILYITNRLFVQALIDCKLALRVIANSTLTKCFLLLQAIINSNY